MWNKVIVTSAFNCLTPVLWALLMTSVATAAQGENVLVVVNSNSSVSRNVAEYYARKRGIPRGNICSISTAEDESVTRTEYDTKIEAPVAACLKNRGLTESVFYIVTTLGVPIRVRGNVALDGDNASIDSELTLLYAKLHGRSFPLNGIVPNPLYNLRTFQLRRPDLSIYLVTRLAAYDFHGVRGLIDRSLAARNAGRVIVDGRSGDEEDGESWLRTAAIRLPRDRVRYDASSTVLTNEKDVIGYASWGSNDPNRRARRLGFTWLPGAIMTEFVSTNARTFQRPPAQWNIGTWKELRAYFAGAPQTLIGDYIEEGVTGVAGNVDEPYLQLTPRPEILLPLWLEGRNLAESYYRALPALSWQNIIIGDPLCSLGKSSHPAQ